MVDGFTGAGTPRLARVRFWPTAEISPVVRPACWAKRMLPVNSPAGWYWVGELVGARQAAMRARSARKAALPASWPMPFAPLAYCTPLVAIDTVLVTSCAEFAAISPVAVFTWASPANSTRGSLMFQPGLVACRLVTTTFVSLTSIAVFVARMLAVTSLAPSIFQSPGANQGRARVSQRAMLPFERTAIGQTASVLFSATAPVRRASSASPWPLTCS